MPDAGFLATILLLIGLFLLALEFFIPSFGMIGTLSIVSLVVSFWCAWKAWGGGANPTFFWTYVFVFVTGVPSTFIGAIQLIERTPAGKHVVLQPVDAKPIEEPLKYLIGKRGTALTLLTPGGMIDVDGQRFHGESVGMLVDPKTPVMIVSVSGNRLTVRPLTPDDMKSPSAEADRAPELGSQNLMNPTVAGDAINSAQPKSEPSPVNPNRIDFDIPADFSA